MLAGANSIALGWVEDPAERPIVLAHEPPFRIGAAELRPPTREVVYDGKRSPIEPRVMQLLVALHRANGAVVSKDDLTRLCWNGRTVGEDAINRVVHLARGVAERLAGGQFRIETITKVGYRLNGIANHPADVAIAQPAGAAGLQPDRRNLLIGGTAALATAALAAAGWTIAHRDRVPREARVLMDDARKSLSEGSVDSPANAVGTLRQATRLVPDSAEAWGLLAWAYMIAASAASAREGSDLVARGMSAILRAYTLEPYQADALAARLWTVPRFGNWLVNERACRAAMEHHPDHPEIRAQLGSMLVSVGRMKEALPLFTKAVVANPRSSRLLTARADIEASLGMVAESNATIDRAFELLPRNHEIWGAKFCQLMSGGRPREAFAMAINRETWPATLEEKDAVLLAAQARALVERSPLALRQAIDAGGKAARSGRAIILATIFAASVGDFDESFALMNGLYFNRGFTVPGDYFARSTGPYVGHEKFTDFLFGRSLAKLRQDARFAVLTRELGLDAYWTQTGTRSVVVA